MCNKTYTLFQYLKITLAIYILFKELLISLYLSFSSEQVNFNKRSLLLLAIPKSI